jgi:hypothetical protein
MPENQERAVQDPSLETERPEDSVSVEETETGPVDPAETYRLKYEASITDDGALTDEALKLFFREDAGAHEQFLEDSKGLLKAVGVRWITEPGTDKRICRIGDHGPLHSEPGPAVIDNHRQDGETHEEWYQFGILVKTVKTSEDRLHRAEKTWDHENGSTLTETVLKAADGSVRAHSEQTDTEFGGNETTTFASGVVEQHSWDAHGNPLTRRRISPSGEILHEWGA